MVAVPPLYVPRGGDCVCTAASSKLKPRNTPHAHKTGTRERESPGRQTWSTHNSSYAAHGGAYQPATHDRHRLATAAPRHSTPRRAALATAKCKPRPSARSRQRATTCRSGARPKSKAQCRRTRLKAVCGVTGPRRATGSDAAHGSAASAVHTHPTEAIGQGRDAGPRAGRPAHRVASTCHGTAWGAAWAQPGRVGVLRVRACARARVQPSPGSGRACRYAGTSRSAGTRPRRTPRWRRTDCTPAHRCASRVRRARWCACLGDLRLIAPSALHAARGRSAKPVGAADSQARGVAAALRNCPKFSSPPF